MDFPDTRLTGLEARSAPPGFDRPVHVTRPLLPPLADYASLLQRTWDTAELSNGGPMLRKLEQRLTRQLGAPHLRLLGSGTLALQLAIAALDLHGEVIVPAFTFPATPHALTWAGLTPVFADICPARLTLSPEAVERAITPATTAILGVHVYGVPCDVHALADIARRHGLRLLYDGAHAFDTRIDGIPVASFGEATMLSLHATKLFHTAEGGALVTPNAAVADRIDLLKNFGLDGATPVLPPISPGINAKMNELEAALGLLVLDHVPAERLARQKLRDAYREGLAGLPGLNLLDMPDGVTNSHQYAVLVIDPSSSPITRDALHDALKAYNVFTRCYFHPLCSEAPHYRDHPSAQPANLPISHLAANQVLCLPYYGALGPDGAHRIADIIRHILTA